MTVTEEFDNILVYCFIEITFSDLLVNLLKTLLGTIGPEIEDPVEFATQETVFTLGAVDVECIKYVASHEEALPSYRLR